jgi:hypothetical protein
MCLALAAVFSTGAGSLKISPNILIAQGKNPPPQDISFTLTGKITDQSPGKITVSSGQNMQFDVQYNSQTEIQHQDGTSAKASELKIGVEVRVAGLLTEAGDIIAKKIVIQAKAGSAEK